jgi:threonine dehydratase
MNFEFEFPSLDDIKRAHAHISKYAHRTPVMHSSAIDEMAGCEVFFKCENFQKVGAFKFRGATNAVCSLNDSEASRGVATHSSGNHAAALALAARNRGIAAYIVMPSNSPKVKKDAVAGYGADITFCEPTLAARESTLARVVARTGAIEIHPYDNWRIITGQATAALELHEEKPGLDIIMTPVGGGGLLAGTALSTSYISPDTTVIAAEPEKADDTYRSFKAGYIIPSENPDTIADGLLTSLGERNFVVIQRHVNDIVTVSEKYIILAMRHVWERMKIIIEPSAAVTLGAIMQGKVDCKEKRVGIIISGGNVDLGKLPW